MNLSGWWGERHVVPKFALKAARLPAVLRCVHCAWEEFLPQRIKTCRKDDVTAGRAPTSDRLYVRSKAQREEHAHTCFIHEWVSHRWAGICGDDQINSSSKGFQTVCFPDALSCLYYWWNLQFCVTETWNRVLRAHRDKTNLMSSLIMEKMITLFWSVTVCYLTNIMQSLNIKQWSFIDEDLLITIWPKAYHLYLILTQQWAVWVSLIYNTRQCESFIVEIKTESSPSAVLSLFKLTLFSFCPTFKLVF